MQFIITQQKIDENI